MAVVLWCHIALFTYWSRVYTTVETPCATTSRKQPPPISDHLSKTPKHSQPLLGKSAPWFDSSKRPPPISDHSVFAILGGRLREVSTVYFIRGFWKADKRRGL